MKYVVTVVGAGLALCIILSGCRKTEEQRLKAERAKRTATWSQLEDLKTAVFRFKLDTNRYPTEQEGLAALVREPDNVEGWQKGGYLENSEVPKDAWGNEFVYISPSDDGEPFSIMSYGADGQKGGEGLDSDMYTPN